MYTAALGPVLAGVVPPGLLMMPKRTSLPDVQPGRLTSSCTIPVIPTVVAPVAPGVQSVLAAVFVICDGLELFVHAAASSTSSPYIVPRVFLAVALPSMTLSICIVSVALLIVASRGTPSV